MTKVADGVYVIEHADATESWPNSNVTVVVGDDGVLVVDANYLPTVAAADIARIRKLTSKPVKYLVITHWHYDHNNGNSEYRKAFPGVSIVAHEATRACMDSNSVKFVRQQLVPGAGTEKRLDALKQMLAKGMDTDENVPLNDSTRALVKTLIREREQELAELRKFVYAPPTVTFDQNLTVYLGKREVQIKHFLRGNTDGDAVIYIPDAKVLATGDLVVHPVPYAFSGTPAEWIQTMKAMDSLDAAVIVPGHGPILHDKDYPRLVTALLESVVAQVGAAVRDGKTLSETRKLVDLSTFREKMVGPRLDAAALFKVSIESSLVTLTYQQAKTAATLPPHAKGCVDS